MKKVTIVIPSNPESKSDSPAAVVTARFGGYDFYGSLAKAVQGWVFQMGNRLSVDPNDGLSILDLAAHDYSEGTALYEAMKAEGITELEINSDAEHCGRWTLNDPLAFPE